MPNSTRKTSASGSATSPGRRSTRSASRTASVNSKTSKRSASTPKALKDFDWDSLDPALFNDFDFDPNLWADENLAAGNLPTTLDEPVVQGEVNHSDLQPSFNLLTNPLSAVPGQNGAQSDFLLEQPWDYNAPFYERPDLTPVPAHPSYYVAQPIQPSTPRRSSRGPSKTPVRDTFNGLDPSFSYGLQDHQYPEPIDPRLLGTGPYGAGNATRVPYPQYGTDDSLFIPESGPPSHPSRHARQSPIDPTGADRRRRSSSSHPTLRSRSSRSSGDERPNRCKSVFQETFKYEQPKTDPQKPWIRTNITTKGVTTRTAKCNSYDPNEYYVYTPNPLGDWSTRHNRFEYTRHGELAEPTYTAAQIRDFILSYPEDRERKIKLQLFIQVGPTDSARRYMSQSWPKCRFKECPVVRYEKGTILHGHYRVAFDERSFGTGNRYDPHQAASAYVHLYCMERFLDFEYICRKAHVYVDTRQFSGEPRGKYAASLAGRPECALAQDFVRYASRDNLRALDDFSNYPRHSDHADGSKTRSAAQIRQFEERGLGPSHILVNKGDLEVLMAEKRRMKTKAARKRKRQNENADDNDDDADEDDNDHYNIQRRRLVNEAKSQYVVSKRQAPKRPPRKTKATVRPQREPWEVDDDEDSADEHRPVASRSPNTRRSPRNARQRIDYTEPSNDPLYDSRNEQAYQSGHHQNAYQSAYQPGYQPRYDLLAEYQPEYERVYQPEIPTGYRPVQDYSRRTPPPVPYATKPRSGAPVTSGDVEFQEEEGPPRRRAGSVFIDPELEETNFDRLFQETLQRRSSSIGSYAPLRTGSILRPSSSGLRSAGPRSASTRSPRSAKIRSASSTNSRVSFARQASTRTFDSQAPPQDVEESVQTPQTPRRTRLQSKAMQKGNDAPKNVLGAKNAGVSKKRSRSY
ncbi:unnamed protein product [Periconia digitata]|uniref:Uncharacterized protein n=1 Tax=Periconia digitata TaxID=1303443 RepID=A0A9W4XPT0_9PLEO|nr:unnamed protein product [Periconia digitata]